MICNYHWGEMMASTEDQMSLEAAHHCAVAYGACAFLLQMWTNTAVSVALICVVPALAPCVSHVCACACACALSPLTVLWSHSDINIENERF